MNCCEHCGAWHQGGTCPRIKAIEYHPNGAIKRVEYHDQFLPPAKPVITIPEMPLQDGWFEVNPRTEITVTNGVITSIN